MDLRSTGRSNASLVCEQVGCPVLEMDELFDNHYTKPTARPIICPTQAHNLAVVIYGHYSHQADQSAGKVSKTINMIGD